MEWHSLWERFEAAVHDSNLPAISKFSYLLSTLKGEASEMVDSLSLTAGKYVKTVDILRERYARKKVVIFAHVQALMNLQSDGPAISVLRKLHQEFLVHVRSLESLHITGERYRGILTPMILSRLPSGMRLEWTKTGRGKEDDLSFLLEFLNSELERREMADCTRTIS